MLKLLKKIAVNDFVKGGIFFTFASTIVNFLNYLFNLISARVFGPQGLGEISSFTSYLTILAVPTMVISSFIIQKIASTGEKKYELAASLESFFWNKITQRWYFFLAIILLTPLVPRLTNLTLFAGLTLIPSILILLISAYYQSILQGLNQLITVSILNLITVIIKLAGPVLVMLHIDGLGTVFTMLFLSVFTTLSLAYVKLHSLLKGRVNISVLKIEKKITSLIHNRQFLLILVSSLSLTLLNNFDIIFVKKYFSAHDTGIYSSWSLFAKIILYSIGPLISVSFIFFAGETKRSSLVFRISLIFFLILGLVSYFIYTFFAGFIINIFFGEKFIEVLPYLGSASIFGSLYSLLNFINSYYLAKKNKISLIIPVLIPFYLLALFLISKSLINIINLNIYFALTALILHGFYYIKEELNPDLKSFQ